MSSSGGYNYVQEEHQISTQTNPA